MDSIIIFCAKYLFVLSVLIAALVWFQLKRQDKLRSVAMVIMAGILALIASRLAGKLYYDPRPFVSHNVKPLIPHAPDNGFPSDHALFTMTLSAALYFYSRKWAAAAFLVAAAVGIARVLAHIHSPIDILGAWAIAISAVAVSYYFANRWQWFDHPAS